MAPPWCSISSSVLVKFKFVYKASFKSTNNFFSILIWVENLLFLNNLIFSVFLIFWVSSSPCNKKYLTSWLPYPAGARDLSLSCTWDHSQGVLSPFSPHLAAQTDGLKTELCSAAFRLQRPFPVELMLDATIMSLLFFKWNNTWKVR